MAETTDTDEAASSVSAGNSSREDITHLYSYIEALPESSSSDVNLSTGVNFNREVEVFPSPRSSASFDSRRDRAPEHSIVPYRYSRSPRRVSAGSLHLRGQTDAPGLPPPTLEALDDTSSLGSDAEEIEIEAGSDTASSVFSIDDQIPNDTDDTKSPKSKVKDSPQCRIHNIIRSRYTSFGDEGEDDMSIELTCGPHAVEDTKGVFRWVHKHDKIMDFDEFIQTSLNALELSLREKRMVKQGLEAIRKQRERPFFAHYATRGRYMEPFVTQKLWAHPSPAMSHLNRVVTVVCFPYFLLDELPKRGTPPRTASHVPLTLLQSFSTSTEPERDTQQVVCRSPVGSKNRCFYVSQLWCMVLDDGHILTCSQLAELGLQSSTVSMIQRPTRGPPHVPFIKVTDGGNCIWQLGLDDCRTWFSFTAHFMDIKGSQSGVARRFGDIFRVTMGGRTIGPRDWDKVMTKAQKGSAHLVLIRRTRAERIMIVHPPESDDEFEMADSNELFLWERTKSTPPPGYDVSSSEVTLDTTHSGVSASETAEVDSPATSRPTGNGSGDLEDNAPTQTAPLRSDSCGTSPSTTQDYSVFHALTWATIACQPSRETTHDAQAQTVDDCELLSDIHQKLLRNVNEQERKAYIHSREKTLPEVTTHLLTVTRRKEGGYVQGLSTLDTFFVAAVQMFELYLPLENAADCAKRYWGSVFFVMKNILVDDGLAHARSTVAFITMFKRVAHLSCVIQTELSKPQGPDPMSFKVPIEFRKAWMHCVLSLAMFRFKSRRWQDRERHLEKCEALLHRGRITLWRTSMKVPLQRKEVASPAALMCALIGNLVRDVSTGDMTPDITLIYREYWKQLEINVKSGRWKGARPQIGFLQQEIKAIFKTLDDQIDLLKRLYQEIRSQCLGWSSLDSHHLEHAPRPELPFIERCIEHVQKRVEAFETIERESIGLERWINEQTALTKDRHDNAIYTFTVVTVVFLPLSFVCSFFGMNTHDIRDMQGGQWIFWVAALPLTFFIVFVALLWTDELGHAWTALTGKIGSGEAPGDPTPHHQQPGLWSAIFERQSAWKNAFKKETTQLQRPSTAHAPAPPSQTSATDAIDEWAKPYRRTPTYKSL